jgi:hypothetical protein
MTMSAEQPRSPMSKAEAANLGLVRPPIVYLVALLIGIGLGLIWPEHWLPAGIGVWVGVPMMIAALALFFSSIRRSTNDSGLGPSTWSTKPRRGVGCSPGRNRRPNASVEIQQRVARVHRAGFTASLTSLYENRRKQPSAAKALLIVR